ncbi:MAG: hypothetical protein LBS83_00985 [Holosporales bacterium]|jgi:hypothetical protein|nr:hypothetical protein [Holosporales bacterium]
MTVKKLLIMSVKMKNNNSKYLMLVSLLLAHSTFSNPPERIESNLPLNLPAYGFVDSINKLTQRIDLLYAFETGHPTFIEDYANGDLAQIPVPLRIEKTGNPIIKTIDRIGRIRFLEILKDEISGGIARYQDEKGTMQDIKWNEKRIITHDSHPYHHLINIPVSVEYEKESVKALRDMIGNTATIVKRNGQGGVKFLRGSISDQLLRLSYLYDKLAASLPKNTVKEIHSLRDSFFTGLSLVNSGMNLLETKVSSLDNSVKYVYEVLEKLLHFLRESKIILQHNEEYHHEKHHEKDLRIIPYDRNSRPNCRLLSQAY